MTEDRIQQEIIMYYRNHYQRLYVNCLIFSIPNGGLRDKRTAMLMKSTGLLSGASDLIVIHFGVVLFVELKTETGKQSDEQRAFELRVNQCGYPYYLIRSLEQFKQALSLHWCHPFPTTSAASHKQNASTNTKSPDITLLLGENCALAYCRTPRFAFTASKWARLHWLKWWITSSL